MGCDKGNCAPYCAVVPEYPCVAGKGYHGRGQLFLLGILQIAKKSIKNYPQFRRSHLELPDIKRLTFESGEVHVSNKILLVRLRYQGNRTFHHRASCSCG